MPWGHPVKNVAKLPQGQQWTEVEVLSSSPSLTKIMQNITVPLYKMHKRFLRHLMSTPPLPSSRPPEHHGSAASACVGSSSPGLGAQCPLQIVTEKCHGFWTQLKQLVVGMCEKERTSPLEAYLEMSWNLQRNTRKKTWITSSSVKQMLEDALGVSWIMNPWKHLW